MSKRLDAELEVGLACSQFWNSTHGRYIDEWIEQSVENIKMGMLSTDPNNTEKISQMQQRAAVFSELKGLILDAIQGGLDAAEQLEHEGN